MGWGLRGHQYARAWKLGEPLEGQWEICLDVYSSHGELCIRMFFC